MTGPAAELLAELATLGRIAGGCDECDAEQMVEAVAGTNRLFVVHIYHDDWCQVLAQHTNRADRRRAAAAARRKS